MISQYYTVVKKALFCDIVSFGLPLRRRGNYRRKKFFLAEISEIWYNVGKGIIDRRKYIWNILLMQKFLADFITVL